MNYTVDELKCIMKEAEAVAYDAAAKFFEEKMGGMDGGACGFAWTNIYGIKGNTKLGRAFKAAGVRKSWDGAWQIWNPSELPCQNINAKEAGARAAAAVFKKYGFEQAYAGSRLD